MAAGRMPLVQQASSPRRMSRGLIALFAVAVGLSVANNHLAQPLLDTIRLEFGVSSAVAGLILTAAQTGYACGLVFLLPLGDLLERRRLVTTLAVLTAAFLVIAGSAPSIGLLLPAVALVGFTAVIAQILVPFAASLAGDDERGRVVGTVMSGLLLGILLGRTASGLIAQVAGWRSVYYVAAGLMLCLATALRLRLPRYREDVRLTYPRLLASVWRMAREEPALRHQAAYGALSFASFATLWTTLAFLLSGRPYGYSEAVIGLFGLFGAVGALTATVAGRLNDRGWNRRLLGAMPLLLAGSFVLLWLGRSWLWALIAGIVLADVAAQSIHISNQSVIYGLRPDARSRVNSVYMTCCFAGAALGSSSASFTYARFGWGGVCVLGAGLGLAGVVLWTAETLAARRTVRRESAPADICRP
jgi:predicted MFS family arabinose efflux permease